MHIAAKHRLQNRHLGLRCGGRLQTRRDGGAIEVIAQRIDINQITDHRLCLGDKAWQRAFARSGDHAREQHRISRPEHRTWAQHGFLAWIRLEQGFAEVLVCA